VGNISRILKGSALCILVLTLGCKPTVHTPEPTAAEINAAIWNAEQQYHEATLPTKLHEAAGNTRKLSEVWDIAHTYQLPKIAEEANQQLEALMWPRVHYASKKKHIVKLMKRVPEGSPIWNRLSRVRDTLPEH
jgi:hypothetical protein